MKQLVFPLILCFTVFFVSCSNDSPAILKDEPEPKEEIYPLSDSTNTGDWILIEELSDEFEGTELDNSKWQIQGVNGVYKSNFIGRPPSQFSINNAIVEDGKLKILTKWEPDYNFNPKYHPKTGEEFKNITTAAVYSTHRFKYGYMEIKCKSANTEITSAFWTTGDNSEMDMFEMFGGHKTNEAWRKRLKFNMISWDPENPYYLPSGNGPAHTRNIQVDFYTANDFHVYGFEWTADSVKIYIDGKLHPDGVILKSELTNNGANLNRWVTDDFYWIWVDSETFPWLGVPDSKEEVGPNGIAAYEIEYIRVWQKQNQINVKK
ncbi:MAG: family 16 glycosylhydrolase [Caldisericaceae bacterium]|nr:family 16 glycosylhydrolase [Caldisericaceae bacterium]